MRETFQTTEEHIAAARVSFRDPGGAVVRHAGRIFRVVTPKATPTLRSFLQTPIADRWQTSGQLIHSFPVEDPATRREIANILGDERDWEAQDGLVLEHNAVPFPSYPWEWPPCMLAAAAELTLRLAEDLLDEGYGLKDATPLNVLFQGPNPVFIDVLSVEMRDPRSAHWLAHGQFVRTFLLPLALSLRLEMPLDKLLHNSWDGLDNEQVFRWLSFWQKLRAPFFTAVTLPVWLKARAEAKGNALYHPKPWKDPRQAAFVLQRLLRQSLRSVVELPKTAQTRSSWSSYFANLKHYPEEGFAAKETFVREAVRSLHPASVLDIGCNNGHFSLIAAEQGAEVVSIDADPQVVGATWNAACAAGANILPLVVNIARPTPASGWRGEECDAFLDRARRRFDLVLLLAVVHHLMVSERVPLPCIVDLTAELTRDAAVVEFVDAGDPMFRKLARGREELHDHYNREYFESALRARFHISRSEQVTPTRRLYLVRKLKINES